MATANIAIAHRIGHLFLFINTPSNSNLLLNFAFKLYHKTCEQFYRNFGLYEKSPNSFLPGLSHSIINQFRFHNFLCLCLASVHLTHPFHLVSAFSFLVTQFRFASSGTISSMRFRAASLISAQCCLTHICHRRPFFHALSSVSAAKRRDSTAADWPRVAVAFGTKLPFG